MDEANVAPNNLLTGLTPAQQERLHYFIEETSEVSDVLNSAVKIACKTLRHGYNNYNPTEPDSPINKELLGNEIRDLLISIFKLCESQDIDLDLSTPDHQPDALWSQKRKWFHFQEE